ncbi:MAG: polymerase sigma70 [Verrucomicrobiaceae bacterium]|nr:polymerase sigma70 [Verrucomicrobiaceae bacterium]
MDSKSGHTDEELRELLQRVTLRDKTAFRALYHALYPPLSRYLLRLVGRIDAVDELLNDVMWVVWEKAGEFRGESRVTTWVLGIATRKSYRWRDQWRRQQIFLEQQSLLEQQIAAHETHDMPEPKTPFNTGDSDLAVSLQQLSAEHQQTLELTYYFGYSCEEIARMMECPIGTVKTRLHYARKRLKQLLEARPLSYGDAL